MSGDLQLAIASSLDDPLDRVRLSLAFPPLGLAAQAALDPYREWLYQLAMALASGRAVVDVALLRRFAADRRASRESMAWLNRAGALMGATAQVRVEEPCVDGLIQWRRLLDVGTKGEVEENAKVRVEQPATTALLRTGGGPLRCFYGKGHHG